MRTLRAVTMMAVLLAVPTTCHLSNRLADWAVPPPDQRQTESLRRVARDVVERYDRLYGNLPMEEWPEQPRSTYREAKKTLAELKEAEGR